ncbi:hypothetical protein Bbelb_273730 [Branchiostoma belcheri]|nr:hypothetical protein Bbelb_273730 [Branchiostoma belcheri]
MKTDHLGSEGLKRRQQEILQSRHLTDGIQRSFPVEKHSSRHKGVFENIKIRYSQHVRLGVASSSTQDLTDVMENFRTFADGLSVGNRTGRRLPGLIGNIDVTHPGSKRDDNYWDDSCLIFVTATSQFVTNSRACRGSD